MNYVVVSQHEIKRGSQKHLRNLNTPPSPPTDVRQAQCDSISASNSKPNTHHVEKRRQGELRFGVRVTKLVADALCGWRGGNMTRVTSLDHARSTFNDKNNRGNAIASLKIKKLTKNMEISGNVWHEKSEVFPEQLFGGRTS